jgi:hypothetical protein
MNAVEAKAFGLIDEVLGDTSSIVVIDYQNIEARLLTQTSPLITDRL